MINIISNYIYLFLFESFITQFKQYHFLYNQLIAIKILIIEDRYSNYISKKIYIFYEKV